MLELAIVGLGRWGQRLVDSLQAPGTSASRRARFTRAVARTPARVAAFAETRGLAVDTDYASVLADGRIGGIVLATPHSQHADQIVAAARAGKPVFVEKPLTVDLAGAQRAVQACRDAGIVLALGHNRRFLPAMQTMHDLIAGGELGQILHLEGNFSGNFGLSYTAEMWRAAASESPAGGMTAMGIHIVDAFIHLCGPIASVAALSHRQVLSVDLDDTTAMLLRFANGASGYIGTLFATGRIFRVQVFGTKGWVHLLDHEILEVADITGSVRRQEFAKQDIERAELEAFAEALAGGAAYPLPIDQAVHGIAVLEAVVGSARTGGSFIPVSVEN